MIETVKKKVRLFTSSKNEDNLVYTVDRIERDVYHLTCDETGKSTKAHKTRIRNLEDTMSQSTVSNSNSASTEGVQMESTMESLGSQIKKSKASKTYEPFNFNEFVSNGYEIWVKNDLKFDVNTVKAQAVCMISPDRTTYETFNVYNGSLGKKNSRGKPFSFTDKMTFEKKQQQLEAKGYIKF